MGNDLVPMLGPGVDPGNHHRDDQGLADGAHGEACLDAGFRVGFGRIDMSFYDVEHDEQEFAGRCIQTTRRRFQVSVSAQRQIAMQRSGGMRCHDFNRSWHIAEGVEKVLSCIVHIVCSETLSRTLALTFLPFCFY